MLIDCLKFYATPMISYGYNPHWLLYQVAIVRDKKNAFMMFHGEYTNNRIVDIGERIYIYCIILHLVVGYKNLVTSW